MCKVYLLCSALYAKCPHGSCSLACAVRIASSMRPFLACRCGAVLATSSLPHTHTHTHTRAPRRASNHGGGLHTFGRILQSRSLIEIGSRSRSHLKSAAPASDFRAAGGPGYSDLGVFSEFGVQFQPFNEVSSVHAKQLARIHAQLLRNLLWRLVLRRRNINLRKASARLALHTRVAMFPRFTLPTCTHATARVLSARVYRGRCHRVEAAVRAVRTIEFPRGIRLAQPCVRVLAHSTHSIACTAC